MAALMNEVELADFALAKRLAIPAAQLFRAPRS